MTLLDFLWANKGNRLTAPGGLGGQCVDLTNIYVADLWGIGPQRLNAVQWQYAQLPGFEWVWNAPTNSPPAGSIVVWGFYPQLAITNYGHVAVALTGDANHFVSMDQNWPDGAPVGLVVHSYAGVIGWHQRK